MSTISIFSHNIYQNIRTRTIVLHQGRILLHQPGKDEGNVWKVPGGGLEPHESLAECARREVLEETGVPVRVGRIAFLLEWVVPRYTPAFEQGDGHGYGLEVFHYAHPEEPVVEPRAEFPGEPPACWVPLADVPALPMWPKQLKDLCLRLSTGQVPEGGYTFLGQVESPYSRTEYDPFI